MQAHSFQYRIREWQESGCIVSRQRRAGLCVLALGLALLAAGPAAALDGRETPATDKAPVKALTFKDPAQAWHRYQERARAGDAKSSLDALRYAADGGEPLAQWKLGSMYAAGEGGVPRDELKAYQYFSRIVDNYDEDDPEQRRDASIVASAYVSIGAFSLGGIAGTSVHPDPQRAMEMFYYAATRFRDADAQYDLARMYLDGSAGQKDVRQAARWLNLAADKDHKEARALLGSLLFKGAPGLPAQRPLGLMYLTLAREAASNSRKDAWIVELHESAVKSATEDEKAIARQFLEDYLNRMPRNLQAARRAANAVTEAAAAPSAAAVSVSATVPVMPAPVSVAPAPVPAPLDRLSLVPPAPIGRSQ
jgi:uncharacterized protein